MVNGGGSSANRDDRDLQLLAANRPSDSSTGNPSNGVAVDPADDHVYVDEGDQVVEFDSAGNQVGAPSGSGLALRARSASPRTPATLDVSTNRTHGTSRSSARRLASRPRDRQPARHRQRQRPGDPQHRRLPGHPDGDYAAFTSTLPLTGYDNAGHREVFRYDAAADTLDCASCNPTGEHGDGDAALASNGLSLTDDGRVFFNSTEGLVDRDLDDKKDAYEWEAGTGSAKSQVRAADLHRHQPLRLEPARVSADGTDAYFFTRDTLVPQDQNGTA